MGHQREYSELRNSTSCDGSCSLRETPPPPIALPWQVSMVVLLGFDVNKPLWGGGIRKVPLDCLLSNQNAWSNLSVPKVALKKWFCSAPNVSFKGHRCISSSSLIDVFLTTHIQESWQSQRRGWFLLFANQWTLPHHPHTPKSRMIWRDAREPNPYPVLLCLNYGSHFAQRRAGAEQNKGRASYIIHGLWHIGSAAAFAWGHGDVW